MDLLGLYLQNNKENVPNNAWVRAKNITVGEDNRSLKSEFGFYKYTITTELLTQQSFKLLTDIVGGFHVGNFKYKYTTNSGTSTTLYDYNGIIIFTKGYIANDLAQPLSQCILLLEKNNVIQYSVLLYSSKTIIPSYINPIQGLFRTNHLGELIIVWNNGVDTTTQNYVNATWNTLGVDDSDEVRIMNVHKRIAERQDYIANTPTLNILKRYLTVANSPSSFLSSGFSDESEADKKLALFAKFKPATITINTSKTTLSSGYLETGLYYITLRYKIMDLDYTSIQPYSREVLLSGWNWIADGNINRKKLGAAINVDLTNLDIHYQYYQLIVTCKNSGGTNSYIFGEYPTTTTNVVVDTIDNRESFLEYNVINPKFERANAIELFDNKLILANVKTKYHYDYQKFANSITTSAVYVNDNTPQITTDYARVKLLINTTAKPDEVLALYLHLHFKNGTISEGYHIPGRAALATETDPITVQPNLTDLSINVNKPIGEIKNYMLYNTGNVLTGKMGYWENENEVYPNTKDFEVYTVDGTGNPLYSSTLIGNKVRHHKIPSLENIVDCSESNLYRFGIQLSNIPIPNDLRPLIEGISVSYAKRTIENTTNISTTPLLDYRYYDINHNTTPGADGYHTVGFPFELLEGNNNPNIKIDYAKFLYTDNITTSSGSDKVFNLYQNVVLDTSAGAILSIARNRYIVENNSAWVLGAFGTPSANTWVTAIGRNNALLLQSDTGYVQANDYSLVPTPLGYQAPSVYNLYQFKTDLYKNFYEQELINTGFYMPISAGVFKMTTSNIFTFDCFLNIYKHGLGTYINATDPVNSWSELLTLHVDNTSGSYTTDFIQLSFFGYSIYNYAAREYGSGNDYSLFGATNPASGNVCAYPDFLKSKHDLLTTFPFNPFNKFSTEFKNMILKSSTQGDETIENQIRTFKANEYVLLAKASSTITNICAYGNKLIIVCVDDTYVTDITGISSLAEISQIMQEGVASTTTIANIGVADALKKPDSVSRGKYGVIASNSRLGVISTPYGVAIFNTDNKQVHIIGDGLTTLTDDRVSLAFENDLIIPFNYDCTPLLYGYHLGYDEKLDRLLLTMIGCLETTSVLAAKASDYFNIQFPSSSQLFGSVVPGINGNADIYFKGSAIGTYDFLHTYLDSTGTSQSYTFSITLTALTINQYIQINAFFTQPLSYESILRINNATGLSATVNLKFGTKNKTYSYAFKNKIWVAEHDYIPQLYIANKNELFCTNNLFHDSTNARSMYKMYNQNLLTYYFNQVQGYNYSSYVDMLYNYGKEKVSLESIEWKTRLQSLSNSDLTELLTTLDKVMVYTSSQCSNYVTINGNLEWFEHNAKLVDGVWTFNDFNDYVVNNTLAFLDNTGEPLVSNVDKTKKDWYNKSKFIDTYFIIRLLHENKNSIGLQKILYINDVLTNVRKSYR